MLDSNIRSYETLNILKSKVKRSLDLKQIHSLTALTLKNYNWLQDCDLVYVIYEIISSNIVLKTVSTLYAAVVSKLKQLLIICFTAPSPYMKEKPFWTTSNLSLLILWSTVTLLLLMFFSLVIPLDDSSNNDYPKYDN